MLVAIIAMKTLAVVAAFILVCFVGPPRTGAQSGDPCSDKNSNAEMRDCYSKEQARVNAETDLLASSITARFRKLAHATALGPTETDLLRKAASALTRSQETWKAYTRWPSVGLTLTVRGNRCPIGSVWYL